MKINLLSTFKNNRTLSVNILAGFLLKGVALIVSMFTFPAYLSYFNNESVLGIWFTLFSVLSWITMFDLGIGNGLRNVLVEIFVNRNYEKAKKYISSAYSIMIVIAIIAIIIVNISISFVNWNAILNISNELIKNDALVNTIRILLVGILVQFVLNLINSILYAMQNTYISSILTLITNIALLLFTSFVRIKGIEQGLILLAVFHCIAMVIPSLVCTIIVFKKKLNACIPSVKCYESKYAKRVMKLGIAFLGLQLASLLLTRTNEVYISVFLNPGLVVEYNVYFKIFGYLGTLVSLAMTPFWSALTRAQATRDFSWINKLLNGLQLVGFLGIAIEFLMIPALPFLVKIWLQEKAISINYGYAFIFALSGGLYIWSNIVAVVANGLSQLKVQIIFSIPGALLNIPLTIVLCNVMESYIAVVIANMISILPFCIVQPIALKRYVKERMEVNVNKES